MSFLVNNINNRLGFWFFWKTGMDGTPPMPSHERSCTNYLQQHNLSFYFFSTSDNLSIFRFNFRYHLSEVILKFKSLNGTPKIWKKGIKISKENKASKSLAERHALMSRIKTQKAKQGQSSSLVKVVIEVKRSNEMKQKIGN